jgi:integrase
MTTDTLQLVLHAVDSKSTQRAYIRAIADFDTWRLFRGAEFNRASVMEYRADLISQGKSGGNINQRLSGIRKLAAELCDAGLLDASTAGAIQRVKGVRREGKKIGNWLDKERALSLLNAPDVSTLKGKRDRAILAVLIGCGLRREECASLTFEHIQEREGRWVICDLVGKRRKTRSIPMPSWTKAAIDQWSAAAGCNQGYIFRSLDRKNVKPVGDSLTPQAIFNMVNEYAPGIAPHDLRRTFAKLAHKGGAGLDQIQLSLGHASLKTTEIYLGITQSMTDAPADHLGIEL